MSILPITPKSVLQRAGGVMKGIIKGIDQHLRLHDHSAALDGQYIKPLEVGNSTGSLKIRGAVTQVGEDTHTEGHVLVYRSSITPNRVRFEAIPEVTYPSANLARNGSFELALPSANIIRYWTRVNTTFDYPWATRVAGRPDNHGSYCIQLGHAVIADGNYYYQVYQNLKPDTIYTVVLYCRSDHTDQEVRITANDFLSLDYSQLCPTTWTAPTSKIVRTFTTDASGTDVTLKIGGNNDSGPFEIDSLEVCEGGAKIYEPQQTIQDIPSDGSADTLLKTDSNGKGEKTSLAEADVQDAITKKHTQGTDQGLDTGGANAVVVADVKDAVTKKHASGSDNQVAFDVPNTPAGNIASTDVQAAINELDTEKLATGATAADSDKLDGQHGAYYQTALGFTPENVANKVTSFSTPTDVQYPSAKLTNDQLALKVNNTGNETIAGIKTFSASPIVPTPTADYQAATMKYVDDNIPNVMGYEIFSATGGTNEQFTLAGSYTTGQHMLHGWRNGKYVPVGKGLTEDDSTHFTLAKTEANDEIVVWIISNLGAAADMFKSVYDPANKASQVEVIANKDVVSGYVGISSGGYSKLGSDAPAIKMKKLTGTTHAAEGGVAYITHGLTTSKIISATIVVQKDTTVIPPHYSVGTGLLYRWTILETQILIANDSTNSENILGKPIIVLITYEE